MTDETGGAPATARRLAPLVRERVVLPLAQQALPVAQKVVAPIAEPFRRAPLGTAVVATTALVAGAVGTALVLRRNGR